MHILLFYQYYHNPDCPASGRHYQFVQALSRQHRVTICTSDVWERKRQTRAFDWAPEGATVHSFPVPYENAMSVKARIKAYAGFSRQALWKGLFIPKPDVIIGSSTPLTTAWAASTLARIRRVPWIFEVRDLWPDFPIQMGAIRPEWIKKTLLGLESRLYRSAAHVVTLSTDMEDHVRSKGISTDRITTLMNGTDLHFADQVRQADVAPLKLRYGLGGKKVVLYAGTFGRANAIPALIQTAAVLAHRRDIHFVFLGTGFYEPQLYEAARALDTLTVLPPEPRHHIFRWFKLANLSLVPFLDLPVLRANSPAKFFDSLAVGTPVIVTNPGWTRSFVETHRCGWYTPAEDAASMARCIERALDAPEALAVAGSNGYAVARNLFDRSHMADRLETILYRCVQPATHNQWATAL